MAVVFDKPSLWQRIVPIFQGFDGPLMFGVLLMAACGLMTMYSVGFDHGTRFSSHGRNMILAAGVLGSQTDNSPLTPTQKTEPLQPETLYHPTADRCAHAVLPL